MVKRHRSAGMKIELIQHKSAASLCLLPTHPVQHPLPAIPLPPPVFFLFPPPPSQPFSPTPSLHPPPSKPVRHLVRIWRRHVSFRCIHFFWWYIVPLRNFIYRRCPLLNLLLVSEHDKRISSMLVHSSYIVLGSQISHMLFRKKLLKRHKGSQQDQQKFH